MGKRIKKIKMPEPTLKDIEQVNVDPQLGGGVPSVVNDSTELTRTLNQNAQFNANNDWRKYQQFLGDYEDRLKTQQVIADKDVADSDRDYLKQQSVDIFKDALKDPYAIYSPEFNNKLAGLRAEAVSSKQARDYAEKNATFLVTHPQINTQENKDKITDFLEGQTVKDGGRKIFTLDIPNALDIEAMFGNIMKDPSIYSKTSVEAPTPTGEFTETTATETYKRKPFIEKAVSLLSVPEVNRYAKSRYNELTDELKAQFPKLEDFWREFAAKHFNSDKDIVTVSKKLDPNANYLKAAKLAQDERDALRDDKTKRYIAGLRKYGEGKDEKAPELPFTPLPSILANVGGYNVKKKLTDLPISQVAAINPNWVDKNNLLNDDYKELSISVGKNKEGNYGVYVYGDKTGDNSNEGKLINESQLKSNAESWLATNAKERKGQEVYGYIYDLYSKAKGTEGKPAQSVNKSQIQDIPTLTTKAEFDALPSGSIYIRDGRKYKKP
jgi:hypothetical protein